jgi:hypothetical protein
MDPVRAARTIGPSRSGWIAAPATRIQVMTTRWDPPREVTFVDRRVGFDSPRGGPDLSSNRPRRLQGPAGADARSTRAETGCHRGRDGTARVAGWERSAGRTPGAQVPSAPLPKSGGDLTDGGAFIELLGSSQDDCSRCERRFTPTAQSGAVLVRRWFHRESVPGSAFVTQLPAILNPRRERAGRERARPPSGICEPSTTLPC